MVWRTWQDDDADGFAKGMKFIHRCLQAVEQLQFLLAGKPPADGIPRVGGACPQHEGSLRFLQLELGAQGLGSRGLDVPVD